MKSKVIAALRDITNNKCSCGGELFVTTFETLGHTGPYLRCSSCFTSYKYTRDKEANGSLIMSKIKQDRIEYLESALRAIRDFGHNENNPYCVPAAPVYECGCFDLSQGQIAELALRGEWDRPQHQSS